MSTSETLLLPSGRTISYAHYGDTSPAAVTTVFYFHGFPASRLEGALWDSAAAKQHIHLIALDRPGMGRSTFQPGRRILDWPGDVVALADHLGIRRFGVLGVSGGAAYALACAKELPRERLAGGGGVACASGLYPVALGTAGMMVRSRVALGVAAWAPGVVGALMDWGIGRPARDEGNPAAFDEVVMSDMKSRPEVDWRCFEDARFKENFLKAVREGVVVSGQGAGWELKLNALPWGFELADLDVERAEDGRPFVMMWHGGKDTNCPIGMADKAAGIMKGVEYVRYEEEGHISLLVNHAEEILGKLAQGAA